MHAKAFLLLKENIRKQMLEQACLGVQKDEHPGTSHSILDPFLAST